jgi:hypothetical protein
MQVCVVEARNDTFTREVDNARVLPCPGLDVGGRTDGNDPVSNAGHRLRLRQLGIDRPDFPVQENEIGVRLGGDGVQCQHGHADKQYCFHG